jgi:photosystem I subunit 11
MADFIRPYRNDPFVGHLSTPVTTSTVTKVFLGSLPAYRAGLSPLLRGLEVGMAHGYLLVGPFDKLGPLRNSEIALLAGFSSAIGLITILVLGLTIYGKVTFPENKDDESTPSQPAAAVNELFTPDGWSQFRSGFLIGAYGGAGFAYLTLLNLAF